MSGLDMPLVARDGSAANVEHIEARYEVAPFAPQRVNDRAIRLHRRVAW